VPKYRFLRSGLCLCVNIIYVCYSFCFVIIFIIVWTDNDLIERENEYFSVSDLIFFFLKNRCYGTMCGNFESRHMICRWCPLLHLLKIKQVLVIRPPAAPCFLMRVVGSVYIYTLKRISYTREVHLAANFAHPLWFWTDFNVFLLRARALCRFFRFDFFLLRCQFNLITEKFVIKFEL